MALFAPVLFLASIHEKAPAAEAVETIGDAVEKVVASPAMNTEERAAKLGFAAHLASDADLFMAIYDGSGMVRKLGKLKIWGFIRGTAEEELEMDPQEQIAEGASQVEGFVGKEMFLAFGAGTATQTGALNEISERMGYHQFRMLARAFATAAVEGDMESGMEAMDDDPGLAGIADDIGRYMPLLEAAEFPPVLAGLRITDADQMGWAEQQLRDLLAGISEDAEPVSFEKGGATFSGTLFKGEMLADAAAADREEMDEDLGTENTERVLAAMRKKQLLACVGRLGDYLLVYFGPSAGACPVADDQGSSLAASERISFIDGFKEVPVHGFVYGSQGMMEKLVTPSLRQIAEGCRDGIAEVEGFGDTRELVRLLDMVGGREKALLDLIKPETLGAVISVDGGARFDLFGGVVRGALDYGSAHRLAGLGEGKDVLLFANWASDPVYAQRASELAGLVFEAAYATAGHVSRMEVESEELDPIKGGFEMFDGMFREDLLKLWRGLETLDHGLGDEGALVIDLKAGFPPVPGVPEAVVEEGRFPRLAYVAPVEERAKLKESWTMVDASLRSLLKSANEMGGITLHMPTPTSSEKNDIVTWYFDVLAFSDDLKPSVTLNDEWFVASTSRPQALELMARAGDGETKRDGLWLKIDLGVLRTYLTESTKLLDMNSEEILADEDMLEDSRAVLPKILEALAALEEFEAVTIHERQEDGRRRATLHFHVR